MRDSKQIWNAKKENKTDESQENVEQQWAESA